jgi:DNA-binding response OmpR family regulator
MSTEQVWRRRAEAAEGRVAALEAEIGLLRAALLREEADIAARFRLPRRQAQLFGLLRRRGIVSRQLAYDTLYGAEGLEFDLVSVDAVLRNLRRNLKAHGIGVRVIYGVGWELTPESRRQLEDAPRAVLQEDACALW